MTTLPRAAKTTLGTSIGSGCEKGIHDFDVRNGESILKEKRGVFDMYDRYVRETFSIGSGCTQRIDNTHAQTR